MGFKVGYFASKNSPGTGLSLLRNQLLLCNVESTTAGLFASGDTTCIGMVVVREEVNNRKSFYPITARNH